MNDPYNSRDQLMAENAALREENAALAAQFVQLGVQITEIQARVAELERLSPPPRMKPDRLPGPLPRPARKRRGR